MSTYEKRKNPSDKPPPRYTPRDQSIRQINRDSLRRPIEPPYSNRPHPRGN